MSAPSTVHDEQAPARDATDGPGESLAARISAHAVTTPFQILGFWAAVTLPFLHVPLLFSGLETASQTVTFLALLALNLVALLVGHSYRAD